jgi:hypothetical protein
VNKLLEVTGLDVFYGDFQALFGVSLSVARVGRIRRLAHLAAAGGAGAVGALIAPQTLYVEPTSVFSVQYSVYMLFMVLVGGMGTIEGPPGRLPGPGPAGQRASAEAGNEPGQGVRYIECGVAVLANSRQRRGPGAARPRPRPPDGNRL